MIASSLVSIVNIKLENPRVHISRPFVSTLRVISIAGTQLHMSRFRPIRTDNRASFHCSMMFCLFLFFGGRFFLGIGNSVTTVHETCDNLSCRLEVLFESLWGSAHGRCGARYACCRGECRCQCWEEKENGGREFHVVACRLGNNKLLRSLVMDVDFENPSVLFPVLPKTGVLMTASVCACEMPTAWRHAIVFLVQ